MLNGRSLLFSTELTDAGQWFATSLQWRIVGEYVLSRSEGIESCRSDVYLLVSVACQYPKGEFWVKRTFLVRP